MTSPLPRRILFVDDEPAMTQLGKVVLERAGYRCSIAANALEGLEKLVVEQPDLVILDYMMPGMSGADMFRTLRTNPDYKSVEDTPVLMLTAKTDNDAERFELIELGLAAYLTKPFGHRELLNVIDNTLIITEVHRRTHASLRELKESSAGTLRVLLDALDLKVPYFKGDPETVGALALALARDYLMDDETAAALRLAALLRNIGKAALPDDLLRSASPLDPDETARMRAHVEHGVRLLDASPALREVAYLVARHQERMDGTGYPHGLTADEIPIGARIVAVLGAFDAMTSERPYRPAFSREEAVARLREAAGTQFDADVVEYFVEALEKHQRWAERETLS